MALKLDILACGAHADDVELACAGTLIKLGDMKYKTGVVCLTRGELSTRGTVEIRAQESSTSASIMRLAASKILDIPDGRVEVNWENKLKIIREIRTCRPNLVLAPFWETRHPDHSATSQLVREAAYLAGLKNLDTGQDPHRPYKVIYYQEAFAFKPSLIVDITTVHERKMAAIMAYKSQFHHDEKAAYGKDETVLSKPEFLERIETRDRFYGSIIGARYAEPFFVRESMIVNDPVAFFGPEYANVIS